MRRSLTVRFGRVYGRPACGGHLRGVHVRVGGPSAGCATERFPVPESALSAGRTRLACISRMDQLKGDPLPGGFVLDERLKLGERPKRHHPVQMPVRNLETVPNPLQVLHADQRAAVFHGLRDDGLGDLVVSERHPASLVAGELAKKPLGSSRPFALNRRPDAPPFFAELTYRLAVELPSCGRNGDVSDSKIDPENASSGGVGNFGFDHDIDEVSVPSFDERGGSGLLSGERFALIIPDIELGLHAGSSGHRPRDGFALERERPLVEGYESGTNLKLAAHPGGLEHSRRPPKRGDDKVGRQAGLGADHLIERMVEPNGVRFMVISAPLGDSGNRLRVPVEEIVEGGNFGRIDEELAADRPRLLHDWNVRYGIEKVKEGWRFLPAL